MIRQPEPRNLHRLYKILIFIRTTLIHFVQICNKCWNMKFLIIYGTTEGQTRKIARFMQDELVAAGHTVRLADASDSPPPPEGFDAVILGASIHVGKYQTAIIHYATEHAAALNRLPSAFYSVCLAVASDHDDEHREAERIADTFLNESKWKPTVRTQVAGALKYTQYDFFKRLIMKNISKKEGRTTDTGKDHEFTDWTAVKQFTLAFADTVKPGA